VGYCVLLSRADVPGCKNGRTKYNFDPRPSSQMPGYLATLVLLEKTPPQKRGEEGGPDERARLDVCARVSSVGISTAKYIINNQMKRIINTQKIHTESTYITYVRESKEQDKILLKLRIRCWLAQNLNKEHRQVIV
jgi:hypothetical protein